LPCARAAATLRGLHPKARIALAWLSLTLVSSTTAAAEPLVWRDEWPKFRPAEIAFASGNTMQVVASAVLWNEPTRNFDGPVLFDGPIRDAIRLPTRDARTAAATVSDMMYYALLAYPAVEAPIDGAVRGNGTVAAQTLAINWEAFAFAGASAIALEKVGRARPMARECDRDPSYDRRCGETARLNTSNVSGHTTIAFTGAGLVCAHHLNLPLYGGGAPDTFACVAAMTIATAQGVLRAQSDNHYATDVILGAALGIGSGYFLPRLLHYRSRAGRGGSLLPSFHARESGLSAVLAPSISSTMLGATLVGTL